MLQEGNAGRSYYSIPAPDLVTIDPKLDQEIICGFQISWVHVDSEQRQDPSGASWATNSDMTCKRYDLIRRHRGPGIGSNLGY